MIINDLHVDPISSWTRIRKLSEGPALPTSMAQNRLVSYMVSQRFPDFPSDVQRFPKKISHGFSIRSRDDSSMVNSPRDFPHGFSHHLKISAWNDAVSCWEIPWAKIPWGNDGSICAPDEVNGFSLVSLTHDDLLNCCVNWNLKRYYL